MTRKAIPIVVGIVLTAGMVWTARPAGVGLGWRLAFLAFYGGGFVALVAYLRAAAPTVRQVVLGAVLFRLVALPMLPTLSDDGYRYLWDGLVAHEAGVSPYAHRPSDPALAAWHDEPVFRRMNSPAYYSVYPPASQALFRASATVYDSLGWAASWRLLKGLLVGFEMLGVWGLLRVAGPRGAALYAWSPLAVVEIAGQGHTEALVVAGLGLVLVASSSRLPLASIGATLAGLAKLYPLALLPAAWRREGAAGVTVSAALVVALTAWFWAPEAGSHVAESLGLFFGTFDAYAAPYRILKAAAYPWVGEGAGRFASLTLSVAFGVGLLAAYATDDGTSRGVRRVATVVVVGFALTASTLHPWYWLPVLLLVPLLERIPLLWLSTCSAATYVSYEVEGAETALTVVGWGGAFLLALWPRGQWLWGQGATASRSASTSVEGASSQRASG